MPLILGTNSIKDTGYNVNNSLRFNDGDSPVLSKTASGSGNRRTWTISWWFKRSTLGEMTFFWQDGASTDHETKIAFDSSNRLFIYDFDGASFNMLLKTNRNFRDISAWYHAVIAVDTTDGTAANRIKMYINGVQETSFETATYPSQNHDTEWNTNNELRIAKDSTGSHFDGYLTEIVNVDGTQLAQTLFGEFDEDSPNIWKPIALDLTFGTNGFYLDFEDSSSLGNDVSGNNNDFTPSNLAATDQSTDTCTNNFATINSLDGASAGTFSEGNLTLTGSTNPKATIGFTQGKWYFECKLTTQSGSQVIGVASENMTSTTTLGSDANGWGYVIEDNALFGANGKSYHNNSLSSVLQTFANNDILGVAVDMDNQALYFSVNGTFVSSGDPTSGASKTGAVFTNLPTSGFVFPCFRSTSSGVVNANFGSPPFSISSGNSDSEGFGNFEFSVPSGYFALCSKNLAEYGG
jgi:hypothetical protein